MNLLRSAIIVSMITFISRISGLLRDIAITSIFGSNSLTDAFWIAFRIPNIFRRLLAEGAFSQALIPIISKARDFHNINEFKSIINKIYTILFIVLLIVVSIGILFSPIIVTLVASGNIHSDNFPIIVKMTRIMFPYIMFMSIIALYSGILNVWEKFFISTFTPILLNISIIIFCIYFSETIYALAFGVLLGGVLQITVQWIYLYYNGLSPTFILNIKEAWNDNNVQLIINKIIPAILGVSITQVSLVINTNIATWLSVGSVTYITLADRLMEFPTAILGVTLGNMLLPILSTKYYKSDYYSYNKIINWALKLVLIFGIPIAIYMSILSNGLVATLFHYGKFNANDVYQTQIVVSAYSIGIVHILSIKILSSAFYSMHDIKTPLNISIISLVATQLFNIILVPLFDYVGLALSISLGAIINSSLLLLELRKTKKFYIDNQFKRIIIYILPSSFILILYSIYIKNNVDWIYLSNNYILRITLLGITLTIGLLIYMVSLFIFGLRLKDFLKINFKY